LLFIDGVKYELYAPKDEAELESMVKKHSKEIFGEDSIYFDLRQKITLKSGITTIPDGYVIKLSEPYEWAIVEIELSTHQVYDHIVTQLSKFISGIKEYSNQKEIIEAIDKEISKDMILRAVIQSRIGHEEVYRFISRLISNIPPKIVVIIDKINGVVEACRVLNQDIKIIELQIYARENAPSVHAIVLNQHKSIKKARLVVKQTEEETSKVLKQKLTRIPRTKQEMLNWIKQEAERRGYSFSQPAFGSKEKYVFSIKSGGREIRGDIRESGKRKTKVAQLMWIGIYEETWKYLKALNDDSRCFIVVLDYLRDNLLVIPFSEIPENHWHPYGHGMSFTVTRENRSYRIKTKLLSNQYINNIGAIYDFLEVT